MRWPPASTLSLRRRVVLGTAIATSIGMLTLTVLLQVVLSLIVNHDIDGVLADRTDAISSTLVDSHGSLQPLEPRSRVPDDGSWIYDASGVLVDGSPTIPEIGAQLNRLSSATHRTTVDTGDYRILATPIDASSGPAGVLVVAERLAPYERTEQHALVVSILLGVVVVAGVTGLVGWAVGRALRPVATMARRAEEWNEHDLSRRFDLGVGGDEITQLGHTLDTLLERVSRVIRAEQRLSSELAHELRTPLTAVRGEAELALARPGLDEAARMSLERVVRSATEMGATIATLMAMSRNPARLDESVSLETAVEGALASVSAHDALRHLTVTLPDAIADVQLAVPESVAVRILSPILDNALRYHVNEVRVIGQLDAHAARILVEDDGPGLGAVTPEEAFSAGERHPESPGAGLGLALSRRLAHAVGGEVSYVDGDAGASFLVELPLD